jgi:hypothetical protein
MSQSEAAKAAARFRTAMELCDLAPELFRQRWHREHPLASEQEIAASIRAFYAFRPGAEHGDSIGQLGIWPRRR